MNNKKQNEIENKEVHPNDNAAMQQTANEETQRTEETQDGEGITREQVQALALEIKRLREENALLKDSIMREKADNDNLRKRHTRELDDMSKYIIAEFARGLTDVMESLHRAQSHKSDFDGLIDIDCSKITPDEIKNYANKVAAMFEGIDMTLKLLEKAFSSHGVSRLHPEGEDFDHRFHQAISQVAADDKPHNTIAQVVQAGYVIKDRLLKPALVIVHNSKTDDKK